jgi:hypothetical protein
MRKLLLLALLVPVSCVTVRQIEIKPVEPDEDSTSPVVVESPVKVHLVDGSTVMFPEGMRVDAGRVKGHGFKYDLTLQETTPVTEIDLENIAAMESYQDGVNTGATVAATTVTTVAGGYAALGLLKAVFGSCPTTYSVTPAGTILEAESFSYSIAPGFEARDVDRLGIESHGQTSIILEMRNEALETHYINHVELLEVAHGPQEQVYPDQQGRPVVVGELIPASAVVDRDGVRVAGITDAADGNAWQSTVERLQRVSREDLQDYLDIEFDVPESDERRALVLRLRNSLLNTVLLYEVILKGQGFRALDWMGQDLDRPGPKFRLARWYRKRMGLHISVWDRDRYRHVATLPDTGPIAWKDVAIPLGRVAGGRVKLRLSSVADNWRIDRIALAAASESGEPRAVPVTSARSADGQTLPAVRDNLQRADDDYVITRPGEYMQLQFDVRNPQDGAHRTWFLAAEGYYIEWMRPEWLKTTGATAFVPDDAAVLAALGLWEQRRDEFRQLFESTKVPVR